MAEEQTTTARDAAAHVLGENPTGSPMIRAQALATLAVADELALIRLRLEALTAGGRMPVDATLRAAPDMPTPTPAGL